MRVSKEFAVFCFSIAFESRVQSNLVLSHLAKYTENNSYIDGELETDRRVILRKYIFSWGFTVDFFSTFPFGPIMSPALLHHFRLSGSGA